jgi:hypothetical protein
MIPLTFHEATAETITAPKIIFKVNIVVSFGRISGNIYDFFGKFDFFTIIANLGLFF